MAEESFRSVRLDRSSAGRYVVHNARGGSITIGTGGDDDNFTPVELLLAAIGGCTAIDVDLITSKRAEPVEFTVEATGDKVRDEGGNRMINLAVRFSVSFPEGAAGDTARDMLPKAVQMSHDRLCTVSRTVELGSPVSTSIG